MFDAGGRVAAAWGMRLGHRMGSLGMTAAIVVGAVADGAATGRRWDAEKRGCLGAVADCP